MSEVNCQRRAADRGEYRQAAGFAALPQSRAPRIHRGEFNAQMAIRAESASPRIIIARAALNVYFGVIASPFNHFQFSVGGQQSCA